MENERIEQLLQDLKTVKKGDVYYDNPKIKKQFSDLIGLSIKLMPENKEKLLELKEKVMNRPHGPFGSDVISSCKLLKGFLDKNIKNETKKQFLNSQDLLNQAGIALRQGHEAYSINLCDSAIESFLKEMFDVPSTIVGAGSVKFLSECMILNIPSGLELYLKEVKNKVCQMNNQIKHKGYVPTRLDAINALKSTEEVLIRKNRFRTLTQAEKRKVQQGINVIKK
ncbi:MAG: hypothetical protein ABIB47_01115 [Candidatus Woesearchaeota archaeon]